MKETIGNRYEFDRASGVIGRGGMGTVYRGIDTTTGNTVAIKQLSPDLIEHYPDFITRFMRESDVLRGLNHPNIITVYDAISDIELGHYLVMEYIGGGSLWDELQATRQLSISRSLNFAKDLASALALVHEKNIIHRDIKPANILIADDKSPRLSDFGVVYLNDTTRITETGGVVGTLDYLSPEMLNGEKVTASADIWAFGVMLYEMVAGVRPFPSDNPSALITAVLTKAPTDLSSIRSDVPKNLARLIEWMLVKNPENRVSSMAIVQETLTNILDGTEVISAFTGMPIRVGKPMKRIGSLPKIFTDDPFYDRSHQQADIINAIIENKPLIGIYGRGGIGKTALVSKVLGDFEKTGMVDGVAYLRANSTPPLVIGGLLDTLGQFLPDDHAFHAIRKDASAITVDKTRALIDGLSGGRYVVYIDNLETLQHPDTHALLDDDLNQFFQTLLDTKGGGALTLVITSRYPIPFANTLKVHETVIRLDEGLPLPDAIQFLREMDKKSVLPVTDTNLQVWAEKVGGYPRGLEALVGYLNGGDTRHIDDLLEDKSLFEGEVLSNVVHQIHEALPQDFRRVLASVAVIGQATTRAELEYLLATYMDTSRIRLLLERLVEGRFVIYNRQNRTYSLHPIDRDYALSSTPQGASGDDEKAFTRYLLNYRMAEYYLSRRKPQEEWKTITDLEPQIREIEYRYAIADYDTTATILIAISAQHLYYWGYMGFVIEWLLRIREQMPDGEMKIKVTSQLGIGYWKLVNYERSLKYSKMALEMSQAQGNKSLQAGLVGNLAYFYYIIGKIDEAIGYVRQGIELSQETHNKTTEAMQWGNLGAMYYSLGELEEAITYYQRGLTLSQEMGDKLNQSRQFVNLGEAMSLLNRPTEGIPYLQESIRLAKEINAITLLQSNLMFLARAYWLFGDLPAAIDAIHEILTLEYDNPEREHQIVVLHGCLTWCMGHTADSIEIFEKVMQIAEEQLILTADNFEVLYSRALALVGLWIAKDDATYYQQAFVAYQTAIKIGHAKGILLEKYQLLNALLACTDKDGTALLALLA